MSELPVKSEPTEEDDKEDGRVTPKRTPVNDNDDSESALILDNDVDDMLTCLTEVLSNCTPPRPNEDEQQNINVIDDATNQALQSSTSIADVRIKEDPEGVSETKNQDAVDSDCSSETYVDNLLEAHSGRASLVVKAEVHNSTVEAAVSPTPHVPNGTAEGSFTPPRPKISLVPTHRLRVKSEFCETPPAYSNNDGPALPVNFFEDLLNAPPPPPPPTTIKDEPIPDNFFDDLLVDQARERVDEAETMELEEKYSDQLKILKEIKRRNKEKKKHKKKEKKKSRKRSRSRSRSRSRGRDSRSPTPKHTKIKRAPDDDISYSPSTSGRARSNRELQTRESFTPVPDHDEPPRRITPAADIELVDEEESIGGIQPHLPEIGPHLTVKQKRERILMRAKTLLAHLTNVENSDENKFSTFLYTSTVRKLPASHSYRNQHIYENRSPLHTVNNVSYKFNSHRSKFNFEEWGLASLPPISAKIAKSVGFDATAVHNKLKVIKVPPKIRNIKCDEEDNEDEETPQYRSSLYCNTATQTDEIVEIAPRKPKGYDIGVQANPTAFEIACQTLETESPSIKKFDNSDDLPIMGIMRELNENQLLALHDFAELLKEPAVNAMDMYRLRQRMLDIYKCSQLPSALDTPVPTSINSYTSNQSVTPQALRQQQQQQQPPPRVEHMETATLLQHPPPPVQQPPLQETGLRIQTVCSYASNQSIGTQSLQHQLQQPRMETAPILQQQPPPQQQSGLRIQTVCSADGQRFSIHNNQNIFAPRNVNSMPIRNNSPLNQFDPRNQSFSHIYGDQMQRPPPPMNVTNKFYGRGGLRR